jgi:glycosyltransferase involved in cell wall biosynthesis
MLSLSFSKAIICPRIGNLKDLPNNVGFFYKPSEKNGLLNCLIYAYKNKQKQKIMEKNSYEYSKNYSWEKISNMTYELYKELN